MAETDIIKNIVLNGKTYKIEDIDKAKKEGTVVNGSLSMGRKVNEVPGNNSVALGKEVSATAPYSQAMGTGTIAPGANALAIGTYNEVKDNTLFTIGNGTAEARSNALVVDNKGNLTVTGEIKAGGTVISNEPGKMDIGNIHIQDDNIKLPGDGNITVGSSIIINDAGLSEGQITVLNKDLQLPDNGYINIGDVTIGTDDNEIVLSKLRVDNTLKVDTLDTTKLKSCALEGTLEGGSIADTNLYIRNGHTVELPSGTVIGNISVNGATLAGSSTINMSDLKILDNFEVQIIKSPNNSQSLIFKGQGNKENHKIQFNFGYSKTSDPVIQIEDGTPSHSIAFTYQNLIDLWKMLNPDVLNSHVSE